MVDYLAVIQGTDPPIPLSVVRRAIPGRKGRTSLHAETVRQWEKNGRAGGVKLETFMYGGTVCTTQSKLQEFLERVNAYRSSRAKPNHPVRQPKPQMSAKELVSAAYGI